MALSFYSSWEMGGLNPVPAPSFLDNQSEVADALIGFFDPIDVSIDSILHRRNNVTIDVEQYFVPTRKKQSVAAKERRRRISEKTQELGRLVPGGAKMNTAEMLRAAFNYVKFLQAQVGILGLMGSCQVDEKLQVLLTSPSIQEKLYGEGKCIVPTEVVDVLVEDQY